MTLIKKPLGQWQIACLKLLDTYRTPTDIESVKRDHWHIAKIVRLATREQVLSSLVTRGLIIRVNDRKYRITDAGRKAIRQGG